MQLNTIRYTLVVAKDPALFVLRFAMAACENDCAPSPVALPLPRKAANGSRLGPSTVNKEPCVSAGHSVVAVPPKRVASVPVDGLTVT